MKDKVRIKSFSNGLILQLDQDEPMEELLVEIAAKFKEGKAFFGRAAVAISFQGREVNAEEEDRILNTIEENCNLKIVCIVGKEEAREKVFGKALQHYERQKLAEDQLGREVQVFQGSLKDGEELETPTSIIILGDVESGCSISSEKNILVLGGIYGKAHAGKGSDGKKNIIAALEMASDELFIGDFKYIPAKKNKWGKKKKEEALVAKIHENSVCLEPLTKEHLKEF